MSAESGPGPAPEPRAHVVLVEPEIPPNTGSVGRLCVATGCRLHLVKPLGFSLEDRYLRRAGLDYWQWVDLAVHDSWEQFSARHDVPGAVFFSARARRSYLDADYRGSPLFLVFGSETRGLPPPVLEGREDRTYRIPILSPHVRSLNLATAAGIVLYEALRQRGDLTGR